MYNFPALTLEDVVCQVKFQSSFTLLVQLFPFCGVPLYPVKHLQSEMVWLPVFGWPELAGQGEQLGANPLKSLYVDGGHSARQQQQKNVSLHFYIICLFID